VDSCVSALLIRPNLVIFLLVINLVIWDCCKFCCDSNVRAIRPFRIWHWGCTLTENTVGTAKVDSSTSRVLFAFFPAFITTICTVDSCVSALLIWPNLVIFSIVWYRWMQNVKDPFFVSSFKILAILFSSNLNGSTMPTSVISVSVIVLAFQLVFTRKLAAFDCELFEVRILAIFIFTVAVRAFTRPKFPWNFLTLTFGFKFYVGAFCFLHTEDITFDRICCWARFLIQVTFPLVFRIFIWFAIISLQADSSTLGLIGQHWAK